MAESVENPLLTPSVRITIDPGNDDCSENGTEENEKTISSSNISEEEKAGNTKTDSNQHSKKSGDSTEINSAEEKADCSDARREGTKTLPERPALLKPSLFLRPSALSGDAFKSSSPVSANSSSASTKVTLSGNKFACSDVSPESLFNFPTNSEKKDPKPTTLSTPPVSIPTPSPLPNPDYVFGQNLLSRVVDRSESESCSNGTGGGMLFSSVLNAEGQSEVKKEETKEGSSLLEDAARCQEQRASKRKYEEVQVTTGEEDEKNVLQITVKLFAFENGVWVERGRGTLRLNDSSNGTSSSRIVVRTLGSLRVVLNTKIWAGMECSLANEKSIRTTALDAAGHLKIFLIQASPPDVNTLYSSLEHRLKKCQAEVKSDGNSHTTSQDVMTNQNDEESSVRPAKTSVLET